MKIAVCGICRNEVDYVEEWVAYYKVSGFDSVYIYDNVSDDGTSELLTALDSLGEIKRIHWPRRENIPPQRDAYGHFIEQMASNYDYVLVCDIDEFLVVEGDTIKELLAEAESKHSDVGAIAFPWLLFGSGGQEAKASGLVIERFRKCEAKPSNIVKTMFCPKRTYNMRTHICDLISGVYIDNTLAIAEWNQDMPIKLKSSSHGRAVINHYYTKSRQEWLLRRSMPRADRGKLETKSVVEFDKYHNQKSVSISAAELAPAVNAYMNEVRSNIDRLATFFNSARIELVSVNKDWVFGLVHGLNSMSPQKIRMTGFENRETIVTTKPFDECTHAFTIKTKWRMTYSESLILSMVGGSVSKLFLKSDWPSANESINTLVQYFPDAEEHIFSIFIDTLDKAPLTETLGLLKRLEFRKYTVMKDFIYAVTCHLDNPSGRYIKDFLSNCTDSFVRQVSDAKNKRRKFIVDAISMECV